MKAATRRFTSGIVAGFLVPTILSMSTAQAAEPVQWIDLRKKIGDGKNWPNGLEDRRYCVVTKDGRNHVGYALSLSANGVRLGASGSVIPREQVAEIRIRRALSPLKSPT
jgi:hypothetical protein